MVQQVGRAWDEPVLPIIVYPDPKLTSMCERVIHFGDVLASFADSMVETMYTLGGVGLAAPQVGVLSQIIVVDRTSGETADQLHILVNPRVTWMSDESEDGDEGCLSLPGVTLSVHRNFAINIEYYDLMGAPKLGNYMGFDARIIQHEIDHLCGKTILDHTGYVSKRRALKLLRGKLKDENI